MILEVRHYGLIAAQPSGNFTGSWMWTGSVDG
jgi:hypothetical protein